MTPFNLENQFDMKALSLLEGAGIPLMSSLSDYVWDIQQALHITSFFDVDLNTLFDVWLGQFVGIRPTWNNLFMLIRYLHLDDLAQQVETYLSRGTMEQHLEGEKYSTIIKGTYIEEIQDLPSQLLTLLFYLGACRK